MFLEGQIQVREIAMFPLKAGAPATVDGQPPQELAVGQTGFEAHGVADREFLLVDEASLQAEKAGFVSQRGWAPGGRQTKHPGDRRLALAQVDLAEGQMTVTIPGHGTLEHSTMWSGLVAGPTVDIFGKSLNVLDQGDEAAAFFTGFLGRAVRLVRADPLVPRILPERYRREGASNQVAGADGMPFLLANSASLEQAHNLQEMPLGTVAMGRYRPNIVVGGEGLGPWAEDSIDKLAIGGMIAYVVKACSRCPVPNVDQATGVSDGKSSQLLQGRNGQIVTEEGQLGDKGVFFGQNLNHIVPGEEVRIALRDQVRVLSWRAEPNVILRS